MISRLIKIIFILFLLLIPYLSYAQSYEQGEENIKTAEAIGKGIITGGNSQQAREKAVLNALSAAVEKAVSEILSQEQRINNFEVLNSMLYNDPESFIKNYKVLAETSLESSFIVMLSAGISADKIDNRLIDMGIILAKKKPIKLVLFIYDKKDEPVNEPVNVQAEENTNDIDEQNELNQKKLPNRCLNKSLASLPAKISLRQRDFIVIDYINDGALYSNLSCSDEEILENATLMKADVAIIGEASVEQTANTMDGDIVSYIGKVHLKAINIATKEIIAETLKKSVAIDSPEEKGADAALLKASHKACGAIGLKINKKWNEKEAVLHKISIVVQGTDELSYFVMFRNALKEIPNLSNLQTEKIMQGSSELSVEFEGSPKSLATMLILKTFDSFAVNIFEISDDSLVIELVPKSKDTKGGVR
jgi:hypothetical protein